MSGHIGQRIDAQGLRRSGSRSRFRSTSRIRTRTSKARSHSAATLTTSGVPPLSALRGSVRFTEAGASLHELSGRFLGGPVRANGNFQSHGPYTVDVDGRLALDAARGLNLPARPPRCSSTWSATRAVQVAVRGAPAACPTSARVPT